jgi:hypothetical protein
MCPLLIASFNGNARLQRNKFAYFGLAALLSDTPSMPALVGG